MPKSDLYLKEISAALIVEKRMGVSEGMEMISAVFPSEFFQALLKEALHCSVRQMMCGISAGKKVVPLSGIPTESFEVEVEHPREIFWKFDLPFISVLADFRTNCDLHSFDGDITEAQRQDFIQTERTAKAEGENQAFSRIFRPHNQLLHFLTRRYLREGMIHLHQRKVFQRDGRMRNGSTITPDADVVDVDRSGLEFSPAFAYGLMEINEKTLKLFKISIIEGNMIGSLKPFTALEDGLQIALNGRLAVVDQGQKYFQPGQFGFEFRGIKVSHEIVPAMMV